MNNLIFKWRDELIQVNPDDIVYFQADGNYSVMMLVSRKEQLLTMNLSKVQLKLDEQLGSKSDIFERVGRDLIIRKTFIYSIQTLRKKLILSVPKSDKFFELEVSKEALKKLKETQQEKPNKKLNEVQLRDLQTRKIYPLHIGHNRFGRKSNAIDCDHPIDNGDSKISRLHFDIEVSLQISEVKYEFKLYDLNSANGTYLSKERISRETPKPINIGAKIKAGNTEFILEFADLDKTEII
jgi:FHA domain/LytTr DNA-binding domain